MNKFEDLVQKKWKEIKTNLSHVPKIEDFGATHFLDEINELRRINSDRLEELNKELIDRFDFQLRITEFYLLECIWLSMALDIHFVSTNGNSENFNLKHEESNKCIWTISYLIHQLSNNITGFLRLLHGGLNFQANLIFRSTIELGSIITAILTNNKFLDNYIKNAGIEDSKSKLANWKKELNPEKINKIIKHAYITSEKHSGHWNMLLDIKKRFYSNSSEFVHSDFLMSATNSYSLRDNDFEQFGLQFFGKIDSHTKDTLDGFLLYLRLLFHDIKHFMVTNHDLTLNKLRDHGLSVVLVAKLNDEIHKEYLMDYIKQITGDKLNEQTEL